MTTTDEKVEELQVESADVCAGEDATDDRVRDIVRAALLTSRLAMAMPLSHWARDLVVSIEGLEEGPRVEYRAALAERLRNAGLLALARDLCRRVVPDGSITLFVSRDDEGGAGVGVHLVELYPSKKRARRR